MFDKENVQNTLGEYVSNLGLKQLRIAETEKFAHVTFFFSGGRESEFEGEERILVPSPKVATYDLQPEMSAYGIADKLVDALNTQKFDFIALNFANGDMVGHTGNFRAATMAVEAVDLALGRLLKAVAAAGGVALITADHGNADEMYELDKKTKAPALNKDGSFKAKTAHTLNPVPLILVDHATDGKLALAQTDSAGLSNIAATVANLLGLEKHPAWDESVLQIAS